MKIVTRGFQEVAHKLQAMGFSSRPGIGRATRSLADDMLADVSEPRAGAGVPYESGALARSGKASGPNAAGVSEVSFGGPSAPYALIQHERATAHDTGESRYLVRGLERSEAEGKPEQALKKVADAVIDAGARA